MKLQRLTLLAILMAGVPAVAGAVQEQPPAPSSPYAALFTQAAAAYDAMDWPRCADAFVKAAEAATTEHDAARSYFAAAACTASKGDKDAAFALLDKAAAKGFRDYDRAVTNSEIAGLGADPRWKAFLAGVQSRNAAHQANAELAKLYQDDQADRAGTLQHTHWAEVGKRDAERRKRVLEIVAQGGAREAADFFHAAMVLQHGDKPEDFEHAHQWCLKALELDPEYPSVRWLAAATQDRYLMSQGKPQLYGTQFKKVDGQWVLWEVDPSITDQERAQWDVPPLAEAREKVKKLNKGTLQPH